MMEVIDVLLISGAAMRLHNFCIENDDVDNGSLLRSSFETALEGEACRVWWINASTLRNQENLIKEQEEI